MLAVISSYTVVSVQMLVAMCRCILVLNIRSLRRERFVYQRRGKDKQTLCKTSLPGPQFTFYPEKELNVHLNNFKLKCTPNSEKSERKNYTSYSSSYFLLPSLYGNSTQTSPGEVCKCLLLHGSSAVSTTCFLGNMEDALHRINFYFWLFCSLAWTPRSWQPDPQNRESSDWRLQSWSDFSCLWLHGSCRWRHTGMQVCPCRPGNPFPEWYISSFVSLWKVRRGVNVAKFMLWKTY